jgi:uncharacterized protein YxjI
LTLKEKEAQKKADIDHINQSYELAGLSDSRKLFIKQQLEKAEVWLGFETRNRYSINNGLFYAAEMSTSMGAIFSRLFMANWRPFTMEIQNQASNTALTLERPFRFYFHELEIFHANGELIGTVKRQFGILRRHYVIYDAHDREVFTLFGPLLHPWTFKIFQNGREAGKITKQWSGLFKEVFSKADNFDVEFPSDANTTQKALLMGAIFLIDFVHFEKPKN